MSEKSQSLIERQVQSFKDFFETTPVPNSKGCSQVKEIANKPSIIKKMVPKNENHNGNKSPERKTKFKKLQNSKGKDYKAYQKSSEILRLKEGFLSENLDQNGKKLEELEIKEQFKEQFKGQINAEKSADRLILPDQTKLTRCPEHSETLGFC